MESLGVDFGWDVVKLYLQHQEEILGILNNDSCLLGRVVELAMSHREEIEGVIGGGDGGVLSAGEIREIESLLDDFYQKASPGLGEAIVRVRRALEVCEGKTVREVLSMDLEEKLVEASMVAGVPLGWEFVVSPNPSYGVVRIMCGVPFGGHMVIRVYDIRGRSVGTVVDGEFSVGRYSWDWGERIPAGIYFVRMEAGGHIEARKLVILGLGE